MNRRILSGALLALSLFVSAFPVSAEDQVGALSVEKQGKSGTPLIFIPGLASGAWTWTDTVARLRDQHVVYLVTLPGFDGRKPIPGTTIESLVRDLSKLIEARHIDKPVLIGHSLGGTLSLTFAVEHSKLISGVVAVDGLPVFPGAEGITGDRSAMAQHFRTQMGGQNQEQFSASQQQFMRQIGVLDAELAKQLAEKTSRSDIGATAEFAAQDVMLDLRARLPDIKVPVVEISPFNAPDFTSMNIDETGKTNYYRTLLKGVEQLEVVSISPARHFVMFDQPEKFAAALESALARMNPK